MEVDITQLLILFDELLPTSNEDHQVYWFKFTRSDGISIKLMLSIYDKFINVNINKDQQLIMANFVFRECLSIRVLDEKRKCLEILTKGPDGRCFLALSEDAILRYEDARTNA